MKKLLSSPLSRRKSSTSTNPHNTTSGTCAKTFGATLSSLAYQQEQQEQDHCPSSLTSSSSTASHPVTITTSTPSMTVSQMETRFLSAPTMQSSMFQSMDIPSSSDTNISTTLSPNLSFDASSLSPSPPITLSSYHIPSGVRRMKQPGIPFIISRLCNYIESNSGLTLEGLFRVSGNVKLVEKLKNSFDTFGDAPLETIGDVPSAAALIKLFLRELPEPVIPTTAHRSFLSVLQGNNNSSSSSHDCHHFHPSSHYSHCNHMFLILFSILACVTHETIFRHGCYPRNFFTASFILFILHKKGSSYHTSWKFSLTTEGNASAHRSAFSVSIFYARVLSSEKNSLSLSLLLFNADLTTSTMLDTKSYYYTPVPF